MGNETDEVTDEVKNELLNVVAHGALHRHEEMLGHAINAAGIGIWSWDLEHPELSFGSDNLSQIHGIYPCPQEESLQVYLASLYPEDLAAMQELLTRCMRGEMKEFTVENRLTWPDGSLHWVEARGYVLFNEAGSPTRLTGIMQEITSRKDVEAQVEEQRQELLRQARMMEQTERLGEIGGWEWDITDDAYYWTPETYRIFGLSPAIYAPTLDTSLGFFAPASATIFRNAIRRAAKFGESFDLKLQLITAQGQTIWVRLSGRIDVQEGQIARIYGSIQNITLRTQIEEQLREAQKMEAIGQLAGGIAHDFNNLLTAINGMSELAMLYLDKVAPTTEIDRVRNYINEIHRAGGRAADLTHQLLAFSRKQVLHPKLLDLRADLMKAQDFLSQILGENIELILVMPSSLWQVTADPSQIEQVIINLVINAREAMPAGGRLTIRLSNFTIDEATARQQARLHPGNYVVLEVQDSGHGMTPEVQIRLFDPFFTTKAVGEGTGLGLATVYGIVTQSGGVIEVESQLNVGSIFRIFLPQATPIQQGAQATPTYVRGGTETILLVEEDMWARQRWRTTLEAKGYRVLEAEGGRAAIDLCQSYVTPIHLLVVNSILEDGVGLALAHQLRLAHPELRLLLLEDEVQGEEKNRSDEAEGLHQATSPFTHFTLAKPINPDRLAAKVRSILDTPASMSLL